MKPPWFPVPLSETASAKRFVDLGDEPLELGGVRIVPRRLASSDGSMLYRIEGPVRSVVFATDFEPGEPIHDEALLSLATDADVLIHDAQYTPDEYEAHRGWGHSTWEHAVEVFSVCVRAGYTNIRFGKTG